MIVKAQGKCSCGVVVKGELDETSREYIHSFSLPPGMPVSVKVRATEVSGVRLVTFAPGDEWNVECPICRSRILLAPGY